MTATIRCAHCGTTLVEPDGAKERYTKCPSCGRPHVRHNFSPKKFPLTLRLHSGKTNEILWSRTITIDEARAVAKIEIPTFTGTEHHPVRAEIEYADGTFEVGGLT